MTDELLSSFPINSYRLISNIKLDDDRDGSKKLHHGAFRLSNAMTSSPNGKKSDGFPGPCESIFDSINDNKTGSSTILATTEGPKEQSGLSLLFRAIDVLDDRRAADVVVDSKRSKTLGMSASFSATTRLFPAFSPLQRTSRKRDVHSTKEIDYSRENDPAVCGMMPSAGTLAADPTTCEAKGVMPESQFIQTPESTLASLFKDTTQLAPSRRYKRWTEEEDEILKRAVDQEGGPPYNWVKITRQYFPGSRSSVQLKGRWKKALCPEVKRDAWSREEDEVILRGRRRGQSWPEIAALLPGRIPEQTRDRFVNYIDPSLLMKKTPWSKTEMAILEEAQRRMGNKWFEISKLLPGRSENAVKNRWHNCRLAERRARRRASQHFLAKSNPKDRACWTDESATMDLCKSSGDET